MATKYGAYAGKVLLLDLTTQTYKEYPVNDKDRRKFVGGKVLAARILNDFITGPIDPLGEENVLVVTTGPLNGTTAPSSSRFNISTVSPLTGLLTSSNCGGTFGVKLKKAGYDALVITGKSSSLTVVEIVEDKVEFKDGSPYKDMLTGEVQEAIGGKSGKLVIGPAGEHLVKYACAVSDERAAGRGGVGAVMGSKNLKAICVDGKKMQPKYNADKLNKLTRKWVKILKEHPLTGEQLPKLGTAGLLSTMQTKHILATKNFSTGQFDGFRNVSGEVLAETRLVKNKGCFTCPIQCARIVEVDGKQVKGPEVEILGLLGPNILNDNLDSIIRWNYELDELGMDTISASGTVAFAMELQEKGLWDSGLEFGKIDNISQMFHDIAFRANNIADQLADGSKRLMDKYGGKDFCIQSKGMELSAYEPRAAVGQGLGYAVSNRGGCHLNAGYLVVLEGLGLSIDQYTPKGKAALAVFFQDTMEAASAGGNCLFTTYAVLPGFLMRKPNSFVSRTVNKVMPFLGPVVGIMAKSYKLLKVNIAAMIPHAPAVQYATGFSYKLGDMLMTGARGYNLERMINERLGVSKKDDTLPSRLTEELQQSDNKKSKVPLDKLRAKFYKIRGWDKDGHVKPGTIRKFGLKNLDNIGLREIEEQGEVKIIPPKPPKKKKEKKKPEKNTSKPSTKE